jgi:hypothetical protein
MLQWLHMHVSRVSCVSYLHYKCRSGVAGRHQPTAAAEVPHVVRVRVPGSLRCASTGGAVGRGIAVLPWRGRMRAGRGSVVRAPDGHGAWFRRAGAGWAWGAVPDACHGWEHDRGREMQCGH